MRRSTAALIAAATVAAVVAGTPRPPQADRVVVGYTSHAALADALRRHPATVVRTLERLNAVEVVPRGPASEFARALRREPGVAYVDRPAPRRTAAEPALLPSPGGPAYEWQYAATHADRVPAEIQRAAAAVTIAVVDTGADLSAPDLAAKAPLTHDVVDGRDAVDDVNGHGTFVASIAAGSVDNGEGIAGFGGDARLLVVKANRSVRTFTDADEAAAIVWAVDHGAQIVNLSLSGSSTSRTERDAIAYAADRGVLLVAAAGNDHDDGNPVQYPAALIQPAGSDGVGGHGLVVGATTAKGARASFSSSGSYVSLAAPGVAVLGAVSSGASTAGYPSVSLPGSHGGVYGLGSGTSYAAPQVSGAAALVWAANPLLSAGQVVETIEQTASNHGVWNEDTGWGVLDVSAAVAQAADVTPAEARVRLSGRRAGNRVALSWSGPALARFRLFVREDAGPVRVVTATASRSASLPVRRGHSYVFTVDAVDAGGTPIARSTPYRVEPAARALSARRR